MKKCTYCGRENPDDAANCSGCGLDEFEQDHSAPAGKVEDSDDLVLLATCGKLVEADLIVSRLGAAGIKAFIPDEFLMQNIGFNLNTYGYVRVQVGRQDYAAAKELLETPWATPGASSLPPSTPDGKRIIASMEASQTAEIQERLKKAAIPFEVRTTTEDSGLDISQVVVDDSEYQRGCEVVERWFGDGEAKLKKQNRHWCPKCGSDNVRQVPLETQDFYFQCKACGHEFPR